MSNELVSKAPSQILAEDGNDITSKIINSNDPHELEELTNMFKMNQLKREIARSNKLSNLLDVIDNEAITRFYTVPDTFNNDQLLKYMSTTQQMIKGGVDTTVEKLPTIQINNQVNIETQENLLSRESRKRILDAVKKIVDSSVIDVEEDK